MIYTKLRKAYVLRNRNDIKAILEHCDKNSKHVWFGAVEKTNENPFYIHISWKLYDETRNIYLYDCAKCGWHKPHAWASVNDDDAVIAAINFFLDQPGMPQTYQFF